MNRKGTIMKGRALQAAAPDPLPDERASLTRTLLLSLDESPDAELTGTWLSEAERREREIDRGEVQPVSAEDVRRKARALLR